MNLDLTHSEEIRQLEFLESDAERRYDHAVEQLDHVSAARAAQDWKAACEALDALLAFPRVLRAEGGASASVRVGDSLQ